MIKINEFPKKQLIFDLRTLPSMGREDYYVSKSNQDAVSWIDRWSEWSTFGLIVVGPSGSGKTHLANVLKHLSSGVIINSSDIKNKNILKFSDRRCVIVENIDENLVEENLFHLFNLLSEKKSKIMITSRLPVKKLNIKLPDLGSRLLSLPQVELGLPDDNLLSRVMIKQFSDIGVVIEIEVVEYLLKRVDRSFKSVKDLVAKINILAMENSRKITVPLVRDFISNN